MAYRRSGTSGYEFTGGFFDRTTGTAGVSDAGSNRLYTEEYVANRRWMRFGLSSTRQLANDIPYWSDPAAQPAQGVGLFGGSYMPQGITKMFEFDEARLSNSWTDGITNGSFQYDAVTGGSYDFTQCSLGELALVRFDFNIVPQIANTTVEVGLIWQTRDANDDPTFTFALTTQPSTFGVGSVGKTFLNRPMISAYFASNEDLNARALPAIRSDNPVQVQPLTTLVTIIK